MWACLITIFLRARILFCDWKIELGYQNVLHVYCLKRHTVNATIHYSHDTRRSITSLFLPVLFLYLERGFPLFARKI